MSEPERTFRHIPVMLQETVDLLNVRPGGIYVDGTLGGGGHSAEVLCRLGGTGRLYGIDRDDDALCAAAARLAGAENFTAIKGNFHDMPALLAAQGVSAVDGILVDLGVSSHQLDTLERGFSYHGTAPLDMRMDQTQELDARRLVNTCTREELTRILRENAEEKWAARIAEVICERRAQAPIETTKDLVDCVDAAIPKRVRMQEEGHSARRTFQALRIAVNDELGPLEQALCDMAHMLRPGGRLVVLTFHSLEDRIVKRTFRRLADPCTCPPRIPVCVCGKIPQVRLVSGGRKPDAKESAENPRARSAMLRGCERLDTPEWRI